jgi:hypothetical protein
VKFVKYVLGIRKVPQIGLWVQELDGFGNNQKNFGSFFTTRSDMQAAQLLINTGRSGKRMLRIILLKVVMAHAIRREMT